MRFSLYYLIYILSKNHFMRLHFSLLFDVNFIGWVKDFYRLFMIHESLFFLNTVTDHSRKYKRCWLIMIWSHYTIINLIYYGSKFLLFIVSNFNHSTPTFAYLIAIDCYTVDHYMCVTVCILLQDMAMSEWQDLKTNIKDLYQSRDKIVSFFSVTLRKITFADSFLINRCRRQ